MARRVVLGLLFFLLFLIFVGPFLVPIPPLEGTVPPRQLADPEGLFVDVDGLDVHYKLAGPAPGEGERALFLLHGFAASTFSWREVMAPLAEGGATVVAFDRPAFGLTERPMPGDWEGASPYRPEAQAALTVGLMDALGIDRGVLVGNSAGGAVALHTALLYPERVEALVLVDAAIYRGGGAPGWTRPFLRTPQLRRLGPFLVRSIRNWGQEFGRSAWTNTRVRTCSLSSIREWSPGHRTCPGKAIVQRLTDAEMQKRAEDPPSAQAQHFELINRL